MSEYKIEDVFEQEAVHDGRFKMPVDAILLMNIINHLGAKDEDEQAEMENPKRLLVRVTIETKEVVINV